MAISRPSDSPPVIEPPLAPPGSMGPPPQYARLRRECPVAKVRMPPEMGDNADLTVWYVTSYADVRELIADRRFIRPSINAWPPPASDVGGAAELITMMEMDGPEHVALRRVLSEAFSVGSIRRYLPRMRQLATQLLATFAAGGQPGDLIGGFAEPFPLQVMCDFVGIAYAERERFLPLADAALGATQTLSEARAATSQLREYVSAVIVGKRREPATDVMTQVVGACDNGAISEESAISFGLSMLVAGYRTTTMFLADAVVALLTHPTLYAQLRDNHQIMPTALDELLRYVPVMNGVVILLATEDVALGGYTIAAGEAVLPVLAAANRDEQVFTAPDTLDLTRTPNPHIMFGRGPHNCAGMHLARAEMTVGVQALLDGFPNLHLLADQPATWDDASLAKSPLTLPVGW